MTYIKMLSPAARAFFDAKFSMTNSFGYAPQRLFPGEKPLFVYHKPTNKLEFCRIAISL